MSPILHPPTEPTIEQIMPRLRFDPDMPCIKCGSMRIAVRWCSNDHGQTVSVLAIGMGIEHLHCKCDRCAFAWQALPMDASAISEQAVLDLVKGPLG